MSLKRSLAASAVAMLAAGSLSFMAPAQAAPAGKLATNCQTSSFPAFAWEPTVDAVSVGDGTNVNLKLQLSDLPGVVPLSLTGLGMDGTIEATVNGTPVTFKGSGKIDIVKDEPFAIPAVEAVFPSTATSLDVIITSMSYNITSYKMNTVCPVTGKGSFQLDPIAVTSGVVPSPSVAPSPSATPSSTPSGTPSGSPTPSKTPSKSPAAQAGVAAEGNAKFACTLMDIGSDFDYNPTVKVEGMRAAEGDSEVTLRLTLGNIAKPDGTGLAPVPMSNEMKVTATVNVDGTDVEFSGTSMVDVDTYEPVAVPVMEATVDLDNDEVPVELTAFKFDFGVIDNLKFYSDCSGGGELSDMTVGIGALEEPKGGDDNGGSGGAGGDSTTTLPRTGGADAMPVIALWAGALGVAGAGLLVWLPRQRRATH